MLYKKKLKFNILVLVSRVSSVDIFWNPEQININKQHTLSLTALEKKEVTITFAGHGWQIPAVLPGVSGKVKSRTVAAVP